MHWAAMATPSIQYDIHIYNKFQSLWNTALMHTNLWLKFAEPVTNELLSSTINNISYEMPNSPILTQREDIRDEHFCRKGYDGMPTCPKSSEHCHCMHLIEVPLGAVVQFALVDDGENLFLFYLSK